eukprot:4168851-Ditylum_brightwellii.AAC.1
MESPKNSISMLSGNLTTQSQKLALQHLQEPETFTLSSGMCFEEMPGTRRADKHDLGGGHGRTTDAVPAEYEEAEEAKGQAVDQENAGN